MAEEEADLLVVTDEEAGQRLDKILARRLRGLFPLLFSIPDR